MHRFQVDLTPGELKVLARMVDQVLEFIQGDGSLSDEMDDDLTSLNQKLLAEARNHGVNP